MGDPIKMLLLKKTIELVQEDDLVRKAAETGRYFMKGLRELEKVYEGTLNASRGKGLFCAVDVNGGGLRDKVNKHLLQQGKHGVDLHLMLA